MGRRLLAAAVLALAAAPATAPAAGPPPGSPEFLARDAQNMRDAYGRIIGPGGQVQNPNFAPALVQEATEVGLQQLAQQVATPTRPAITPGNVFPGWNAGNPLRRGWNGKRGQSVAVSWTNRYGALIRGHVFAPLPGATDPYTKKRLKPPYPGVVITTGSVQGSERMYFWLAQDLAERGYVVLTYDVQGQGTSETFPHENDQVNALPFCNPFAEPQDEEQYGCPGVPAQQESNFTKGTEDALTFLLSTKSRPYPNKGGEDAGVNAYNPLYALLDRRTDSRTATPGRTTRVAIIGHSLGAFAVSKVQGRDKRVQAVVALDKLQGDGTTPKVPALAVQSEYGFTVNPYILNNGSSLTPTPGAPDQGPDPRREMATGFDAWRKAGVDAMLVVPRASTHLEYTDIAYALPASRYGQALTSVYVQAFLQRYLQHDWTAGTKGLAAGQWTYLEPVAVGRWEPVTLERDDLLSFYYCSATALRGLTEIDPAKVGGC
ncbi:MAG: alpha/beta hydrolase [Solirubrobacterales bacterium]|nr:alpha/beta hydrolase [Solirubrobacterales bacterium]